jgi:hypothetical protein
MDKSHPDAISEHVHLEGMTMATLIPEASVPMLPPALARETAVVAGFGIGANVFALFSHTDKDPVLAIGLGLLALIFTTIGVHGALHQEAFATQRLKRLFWWCVAPPTILFSWTLFGVVPGALAGIIAWAVVLILTEGTYSREHQRERTALWIGIAAMTTQHAAVALTVIVPMLAYVFWVAHNVGAKPRVVVACVAASQAILGALLWPFLLQ